MISNLLTHYFIGTRYFKQQGVQATLDVLKNQVLDRIQKANPNCSSEVILANDYLSYLLPNPSGADSITQDKKTVMSTLPDSKEASSLAIRWERCDNFFLENQRFLAQSKNDI